MSTLVPDTLHVEDLALPVQEDPLEVRGGEEL